MKYQLETLILQDYFMSEISQLPHSLPKTGICTLDNKISTVFASLHNLSSLILPNFLILIFFHLKTLIRDSQVQQSKHKA